MRRRAPNRAGWLFIQQIHLEKVISNFSSSDRNSISSPSLSKSGTSSLKRNWRQERVKLMTAINSNIGISTFSTISQSRPDDTASTWGRQRAEDAAKGQGKVYWMTLERRPVPTNFSLSLSFYPDMTCLAVSEPLSRPPPQLLTISSPSPDSQTVIIILSVADPASCLLGKVKEGDLKEESWSTVPGRKKDK